MFKGNFNSIDSWDLKFINSFGESAITAQKSRSINDLLYIYHLNQSINRK